MAYEVFLKYYEQKQDGTYDNTNLKTNKKKLGDIDEEYPVEKLMSYITGQLARRDIFVHDVEVYEFTKRKVPFKITKNGLVLKNQKVSYEETLQNTCLLVEQTNVPTQVIPHQNTNEKQKPKPSNFVNLNKKLDVERTKKPIRAVIFSPPLDLDKKKFPYKFTKNKKYMVYSERFAQNGIGQILRMNDDNNNAVEVHDEYFISADNSLGFSDELNYDKKDGNVDLLNWQGTGSTDMPVIRK